MRGKRRSLQMCCSFIFLSLFLAAGLIACGTGNNAGNTGGNTSTSEPTSTSSAPAGSSQEPLKVTGVMMAVSPSSLSSYSCGTSVTVTYTATFHFSTANAGGQVQFQYTTTNGRGSTPASLSVPAGQTSAVYKFTWSGQLPADHTQPGPGGVMVTSPNALNSPLLAPSGACSTGAPAAFQVTGVDMSASPALTGHACGSAFTETYTATFHIAPNGPGGQVQFQYTTTNGRGSTPANFSVAAGQTSAVYTFTWSGNLPADHTAPGPGGVMVTSPNALTSQLVTPSGTCSTSPPAAFHVTSISLSASPALTGHACGSAFTETYTATFHIAPNGPGGTLVFQYTTNNGRGSTNATLHVAAGQTSAVYTFTWSGNLPADHTAPGIGIVLLSSPNQITSPSANPVGQCS